MKADSVFPLSSILFEISFSFFEFRSLLRSFYSLRAVSKFNVLRPPLVHDPTFIVMFLIT